jgi:hypothetical protein
MTTYGELKRVTRVVGMVILAFILGCGVGFALIVIGLTASRSTPSYSIHLVLIIMGILSFAVTVPAPRAWWAVAACIGFAPILLFSKTEPVYFVEAVVLAFGPAWLVYRLTHRMGD